MRSHVIVCTLGVVACSSTAAVPGGGSADGGTASGSDASSAAPAETVEVAEVEPNNGPERAGFQDIGAFTDSKTIKLRGRLATGGSDGTKYTGDFDGFAFNIASAGGQFSLQVDWTGTADVDAILYDAQLAPAGGDDGAAKPITKAAQAPVGDYVLVLFSKDQPADWTATLSWTKPGAGGACVSTLVEQPGGGCSFTMNEPTSAESITLPYTFGWRSDGCETPGKVFVYGDPPTEDNWISFEYTRGGQASLLNVTGRHMLTAAELAELRSPSGIYHWQLQSFHGARSAGQTFTIAPKTCR